MATRIVAFNTVLVIATALVLAAPRAQQSEPGLVLQNLFAARNSADFDRAATRRLIDAALQGRAYEYARGLTGAGARLSGTAARSM